MSYAEMAAKAKKDGAMKQLTVEIKSWKNPDDSLIGRLESVSDFTGGKFEKSCKQYLFETDSGMVTTLFGGATDKQLEGEELTGKVLQVIFKGQDEIEGGRKVNKFDISVIAESK